MVDKKLAELKQNNQQVIEVTFNSKIEEQLIQQLQNIVSCKNNNDNSWFITFESKEDMRPKIFDFAQENGLKILGLKANNKSLETLFREFTS